MWEMIPVPGTYFYRIENGYITVSQPGTGCSVLLAGAHRQTWEYLQNHRGETVAEIADALEASGFGLPRPRLLEILTYFQRLNLLTLESSGGWA